MKAERLFDAGHLPSAEHLDGELLAPRWRRVAALALDGALVLLPAVAVALGVALLVLRSTDPTAYAALKVLWSPEGKPPHAVHKAWGDIAPLLVKTEAAGLPEGVREAVASGKLDEAADLLADHNILFTLAIGEREEIKLSEKTLGFHLEKIIPKPLRAFVLYGVMALYFTLFTSSRKGATPGKRLLRIRVASLEGARVPLMESLERFAGYIEIPATLGFALFALWRDPNRRLPHDRVAGTVVLLARKAPKSRRKPGGEGPHSGDRSGESPGERTSDPEIPADS